MAGFEHLLESQLAELGRLVGASGLAPNDFAWRDGSYERYVTIPELRHDPTNYRFQFTYSRGDDNRGYGRRPTAGRHHAKFTPGRAEEWEEYHYLEWEQVLEHVERWLGYLNRELHTESYWEGVARGRAAISGHEEDSDDEPLEEGQVEQLEQALQAALQRIGDLEDLQAAEYQFVRAEFEELKQNLRGMKRRGWAKMALGTFVNLAARQVVSQDSIKEAWQVVVGYLEGIPGMLPPGP